MMAKLLIQRSLQSSFIISKMQLNNLQTINCSQNFLQFTPVLHFHTSQSLMKKGKSKGSKQKSELSDIVDQIEIEDEEENEDEVFEPKKDTELRKFLSSKSKGKKPTKGSSNISYDDFVNIVNGESLWKELESQLDILKDTYTYQLSVRSATSIDEIQVQFEGDTYPLNEIASLSKKDPKKVIIDASAFPQAATNIMTAIRDSGMNLNPQQEGLTIYVPIPKVTKEFREKLAAGAKKKLTESKDSFRKVQNKFIKKVSESELSGEVSKDDARAASDAIKSITDNFMSLGDQLCANKCKDILGK